MSALVHRCLQLETTAPLKVNPRGLFAVKLADVIAAFNREHPCPNLEIVTTVTTETQQQAQQLSEANGVAEVAQRPAISDCQGDAISVKSVVFHGDAEGQQFESGSASALSRRSIPDLHDRECGRTGVPSTRNDHPASVGQHGPPRGKTQEQEFHGCGGMRRLQENGIQPKVTARDSHWHLGRTEVHGSIIKSAWTRKNPSNHRRFSGKTLFRQCVPITPFQELRDTLRQFWAYPEDYLGPSPPTLHKDAMRFS